MNPAPPSISNIAVPTVTYTQTLHFHLHVFVLAYRRHHETVSKLSKYDNFYLLTRMCNRFRKWYVGMNVMYNREYLI